MIKNSSAKIRVFMGMTEIAGYFTRLSDSFEELGIENYFVDIGYNSDNYDKKYKKFENTITRKLRNAYTGFNTTQGLAGRSKSLITFGFYMFLLFIWALLNADAFIFIYGNTFFSRVPILKNIDLKLLKLFRKKIIFLYVGSDSRALYASSAVNSKSIDEIVTLTLKQNAAIRTAEKYATCIIDNPASSHFHGRKFISFFQIGMPIDHFEGSQALPTEERESVVILHAPSKPELKGTDKIRETINNLKTKGYHIEYVELIGVPNHVVRENINNCDFIIDELYSDCLLAGFSTEAALAGKSAVIGGYAGEFLKNLYPDGNTPPSVYINPNDLEKKIENMLADRSAIHEIGTKARAYVLENWNSNTIAEKYISIFKGDVPDSWYYNPYMCDYIFGCGIHKEKIKRAVTEINNKYGISALCIDDKPKLIEEYKKLIED